MEPTITAAPHSFEARLRARPMPAAVGDVRLRNDGAHLVGEARRRPVGRAEVLAWLAAGASAVVLGAGFVARASVEWLTVLLLVSVGAFVWSGVVEQRRRQIRRFVLDSDAHVLRLDFSSPVSGHPRTWRVPFTEVRRAELVPQLDGRQALVVEVELDGGARYLEALAVDIEAQEHDGAERLLRLVVNAVQPRGDGGAATEPVAEPAGPVDGFDGP